MMHACQPEAAALRRSLGGWCLLMVVAMALSSGFPEGDWLRASAARVPASGVAAKIGAPVARVEARPVRLQRERPAVASRSGREAAWSAASAAMNVRWVEPIAGPLHGVRVERLALPPPAVV